MLYAMVFAEYGNGEWEDVARRAGEVLEAAGFHDLFMSNALAVRQCAIDDPDFDVRAYAHGCELVCDEDWRAEGGAGAARNADSRHRRGPVTSRGVRLRL